MDILEKLVKKDKQIILVVSRGKEQDLEIDIYTKGGLKISKTDEMMLKNINVFEMIDKEDYVLN